MGFYKSKINKFTGVLQQVFNGKIVSIKAAVLTSADLPLSGNSKGEARIATDTGHLYIWTSDSASGDLSDWDDQGDIIDVVWSAISGKPTSDVEDIDDAVTKRHTQDTDQRLDDSGTDEVSANELRVSLFNQIILFIRTAIENTLSIFEIVNGIIDAYFDQTGIDAGSSEDQSYNAADDYYQPTSGYDAYTVLMLHLNGADGATETEDVSDSAHTVTFNDDAQLDTDQKKFGTASLLCDGNNDYLAIGGSRSDWAFGSDDFTIEFWFRLTKSLTNNYIMSCYDGAAVWQLHYSSSAFIFHSNTLSQNVISGAVTPDTGQWYHLELSRASGTFKFFLDGTELPLQQAATGSVASPDADLAVGGDVGVPADNDFPGWLDEVRISKGIARHTEDFSVQTEQYSGETSNMTLVSDTIPVSAGLDKARVVCIEEDVDEITLNTDLILYVSRDDGITWTQATLEEVATFYGDQKVLIATVDVSAQPVGSDFRYKFVSANEKVMKLHAIGLVGCS